MKVCRKRQHCASAELTLARIQPQYAPKGGAVIPHGSALEGGRSICDGAWGDLECVRTRLTCAIQGPRDETCQETSQQLCYDVVPAAEHRGGCAAHRHSGFTHAKAIQICTLNAGEIRPARRRRNHLIHAMLMHLLLHSAYDQSGGKMSNLWTQA